MKQIRIEHVTKTFGEKTLLTDISFTISEGERIGLIGINGTGKSTLLEVIAGKSSADSGEMIRGKDYTISYLAQDPALDEDKTVIEAVFKADTAAFKAIRNYESILRQMENQAYDHQAFFQAEENMNETGAWDKDTEAKTILDKLGIKDINQTVGTLSGGQKKRVGLAQVLIETPDLLILDEPTNHLDYTSIRFLESYLNRFKGAVLLVTHDRYFLDQVTNHIVELDRGTAVRYIGNYEKFMEQKAIRLEQETHIAEKNENLYRRELAWMRRGAKARSTKQKARKDRFGELEKKVKTKSDDSKLEIDMQTSRLGKDVFTLNHLEKYYGDHHVLRDFSLIIQPGERIGITGNNGTGKSTLLNLLAEKVLPDSGELIVGGTVRIGYYTQENITLDPEKRIISFLQEVGQEVVTTTGETLSVSSMLERFLFPASTHGKKIGSLSGGEKRRLFLLKILMEKPNVLLLDEPTNDLDTETLTVLEDYLQNFAGTIITVSHDRYFLDKITEKLLVFEAVGKVKIYYGEYSDYLAEQEQTVKERKPVKKQIKPQKTDEKKEKIRLTYMEQREWETIETTIEEVEQTISHLNEELEKSGSDFVSASELSEKITAKEAELEQLMERWEYLSTYAD
ncbi:ABC-F family ATP-binding cassette domain-containing protein [Listeria sp. PSOL-1]|uniref:ABC-F family ATP-binding cassette domain-containing protein n=1 Tax=Listeria sp. PSOL-1 TaxID=1844999 RepID=UPI0013D81DDA|nr:ABC-F family ATP-binding cassette domain-containing protein [Listeria sp. PSOL-1]